MKSIVLFTFVIFSLSGYAQGRLKTFNDISRVRNFEISLNDTVINKCEVAYIINSKTLDFYKASSKDLKEIILLQEKRIVEQDEEYKALKMKFDSVTTEATKQIDRSSEKLQEVHGSLVLVDQKLQDTQKMIQETQQIVKEEKANAVKTRLKWGVGGFTVGIAASALLLILAN